MQLQLSTKLLIQNISILECLMFNFITQQPGDIPLISLGRFTYLCRSHHCSIGHLTAYIALALTSAFLSIKLF